MSRFRRISLSLAALAMAASATAASTAGATVRDVLQVGLSSRPQPFDPAIAGAVEETAPIVPAYEQLLTHAGLPQLAQSWTISPDGLVWTFKLAHGHRFDDGSEVDARAVKFSFDRLIALGRQPAAEVVKLVAAVDVLDGWTVRMTLRHPAPRLASIISERGASIINPAVARFAVNGDWGSGWLDAHTAGSGAYRLRADGSSGAFILDRNPYWAGPRPYFSEIIYKVIPDPTVRALAVQQGAVDIAVLMPAETLRRLAADPDVRVVERPALAFQALAFNMESAAFRDVRLRRAVAEAIDTQAIIRYLRGGHAIAFQGPLPVGMPGADPALYPVHYDPAGAATAAAGARRVAPVVMIYPGVSPVTDTVAEYIQASLAPLGLQVRLERLSVAAYSARLGHGSYDMALVGLVASDDDPAAILTGWFDPASIGGENAARYSNPDVTRLIHLTESELSPIRRAALDRQIVELVNRDLPYIYLQQTEVANVVRRDITGYSMDPAHALELPLLAMGRRP